MTRAEFPTPSPPCLQEIELKLFIEAIFLRYSYDFREYSPAFLKRRLEAAQSRFGARDFAELQARVLHEPEFFMSVLQLMTIPTTEMFRDPEYFRVIREKLVPTLKTYASLKVWVAGCSTGEEAYSLAILFREEGLLERTLMYATDINPKSLKHAESGIFSRDNWDKYAKNYEQSQPKGRFEDYCVSKYDMAVLDPHLRKNIVFADHSLATDSVFSEMHFVSCRNTMIYFNPTLQNRAIGLFHDSLARRGFLGIGSKENLRFSAYENQFEVVSRPERIYQKTL